MSAINTSPQPPRGLFRRLLRLPVGLYRARLGWLLGNRFLMLTHIGRKSGLPHRTVVEVVRHDKAADAYIVVSGFGDKADWYRNICKTPNVTVHVGRRRFEAFAQPLALEESVREFQDYAQRHPTAFKALSHVLRYPWDGSEASFLMLARLLPVIILRRLAPSKPARETVSRN